MGMTVSEKILADHAGLEEVKPGQLVEARCDMILANDITAPIAIQEFSKLNAAGVPCGPVNNIGEAFEDAQVKHLKMAKPAPHPELGEVDLIRSPINLSAFPQPEAFDHAAPDPGQDSESVLREAGYSAERIAQFKAAGVI